jgi:hypothetical protein
MRKVIHKFVTCAPHWGYVHTACRPNDSVDENKTSFSTEWCFVNCKACLKKQKDKQSTKTTPSIGVKE